MNVEISGSPVIPAAYRGPFRYALQTAEFCVFDGCVTENRGADYVEIGTQKGTAE